jgi:hypothetical protein
MIYRKYLSTSVTDDPIVLDFAQLDALDLERFGRDNWKPKLDIIKRCYQLGKAYEPYRFYQFVRRERTAGVPLAIATQIAQDALAYPGYLVSLPEEACKRAVASQIVPVADIAERENWFVPVS